MRPNKLAVVEWSRRTLGYPLGANAIILDTETTGLDHSAEIIQLAIIDTHGETLLDTLIRPTAPPDQGSIRIHGLTAERLATAPALREYAEQLQSLLITRPVLIYNADFDLRLLRQSLHAHQLAFTWLNFVHYACVMEQYAVYHGERRQRQSAALPLSASRGGYR